MLQFVAAIGLLLSPPSDPGKALDVAIATVEHQEATLERLQVDYTIRARFLDRDNPKALVADQTSKITERRAGERRRILRDTQYDGRKQIDSPPLKGFEVSYDGRERRSLTYTRNGGTGTVTSDPGRDQTKFYDLIYSLEEGTYSERLRAAKERGTIRWATWDGARVLRCVFPEAAGYETMRTIDLDPKHGWQPRRFAVEFPKDARMPNGEPPPSREFRVLEYAERDGFVLPSRIEVTYWIPVGGTRNTTMAQEIRASSIEFNPVLADDVFTMPFPDGALIHDLDRHVVYIVGQPGSERPAAPSERELIAAASPGGLYIWWADFRVWLSLAAVFAAAIVLKLRRHARSPG